MPIDELQGNYTAVSYSSDQHKNKRNLGKKIQKLNSENLVQYSVNHSMYKL